MHHFKEKQKYAVSTLCVSYSAMQQHLWNSPRVQQSMSMHDYWMAQLYSRECTESSMRPRCEEFRNNKDDRGFCDSDGASHCTQQCITRDVRGCLSLLTRAGGRGQHTHFFYCRTRKFVKAQGQVKSRSLFSKSRTIKLTY